MYIFFFLTWQRNLAGWSRDTTTVKGFERRHTGASVESLISIAIPTSEIQRINNGLIDMQEKEAGKFLEIELSNHSGTILPFCGKRTF